MRSLLPDANIGLRPSQEIPRVQSRHGDSLVKGIDCLDDELCESSNKGVWWKEENVPRFRNWQPGV